MKKLRVCKVIIYCEISKWVKSLLILFGIFAELYNGWRIVDRCRLAQCSCSLILCTFWHLLLIVIFVLLVRWLLVVGCIFTCLEIDIFYTLAFSEKLELLCLRAHWCQRLIWKLKVLSSALLEDRHYHQHKQYQYYLYYVQQHGRQIFLLAYLVRQFRLI